MSGTNYLAYFGLSWVTKKSKAYKHVTCGLYYKHIMVLIWWVSWMMLYYKCGQALALVQVSDINYDRRWRSKLWCHLQSSFCGLYYKPIMIVNDDSSIINKFETSLLDDARVIIYNRNMFIVKTTDNSQVMASLTIVILWAVLWTYYAHKWWL